MTLGFQRVRNHDIVKVGHLLRMMDKSNLQEWIEQFQKMLFEVLKCKHMIYLQTSKINEGYCNKSNKDFSFKVRLEAKQNR